MLDPSTGFASMFANVASMRNRGVEIALSYDWFKPSDRKDFSWSTSLTFTHNKNEVTKVQNAADIPQALCGAIVLQALAPTLAVKV